MDIRRSHVAMDVRRFSHTFLFLAGLLGIVDAGIHGVSTLAQRGQ